MMHLEPLQLPYFKTTLASVEEKQTDTQTKTKPQKQKSEWKQNFQPVNTEKLWNKELRKNHASGSMKN